MNLTFYSNYNNYSKRKRILFPSIFSHFVTEVNQPEVISQKKQRSKVYLPYYKNIKEEMKKVKTQMNSLFNIKNSIFKQMKTKYTSMCYKNFVKGFAKYFFGPYGYVTKRYKLLKEYYLHKNLINSRIYAGRLDYYDVTSSNSNNVKARENETKKRRLTISSNFAVVFDQNDMYSVKALTSKRLYNYKKNFVDINRKKCFSKDLQQINEISDINPKKENKNKMKLKKKIHLSLNANNILNKINNDKKKNFSFITEYNKNIDNKRSYKHLTSKSSNKPYINLKFNNTKYINRKSNLFLTQNYINNRKI